MLLEAPPPRRQVSSAPVSLSAASAVLEKYLQDSETHAHLHPDALITPDGVTFNAKGGAVGNLLMHHLRRVAAGLRGEYLEPDTTLEAQDEALDTAADGEGSKNTGAEQDWQDKATYQAELGGIEIGDVGNRTNVVQEGGQEPPVQTNDTKKRKKDQAHDHDHNQQSPADGQVDKDARKKAKKERDLQRKRDNAAKAKKSD